MEARSSMAAARRTSETAAPLAARKPGRPNQEKNQSPSIIEENEGPSGTGEIKGLLEQIDTELGRLKEGRKLKELIGELKTQLIGKLLTTVKRVEKSISASPAQPTKAAQGLKPTYAAALGATPSQPTPVTPRELREIQVRRANLTSEEAAKTTEEIIKELNNKFNSLGIGRILGARRLQGGDLVLLADSSDTKRRAEAKKEEWVGVLSSGAELRSKKYTVLVHGVQVDGFDNQRQTEGIEKIYEQNPAIRNGVKLTRIHWRKRILRLKKTSSSLILDVTNPEGANILIKEGLAIDGELKEVERFDAQCLVTRCYNCQKYGHNARNCQHSQRCGYCAAPGHIHDTCTFKGDKAKQRCANCSGGHKAGSQECNKHKEEINRSRQAREAKPRLFNVPIGGVPPPVETGLFETTASTGKRQADQPRPVENQQGSSQSGSAWETPARKQRGRPKQPLATPTDSRLSSFFPQITQRASQTSLALALGSQNETDTEETVPELEMLDTSHNP